MKKLILILPVVMLVVGCANNKNNVPKNKSVTEIAPSSPVAAPREPQPYAGPLNGAPQAQPTYYEPAVSQAPVAPASGGAGGQYTVKKGDTLFSIAKANYGNGNQWQRIAQANPGLSPNTLKAGQRIVIP